MNLDYKAIGRRVRAARERVGITQQRLAEISNLSPTNISHIERGNTKLSLPSLVSLANALEVTVDELLCDNIIKSKYVFQNEITQATKDCDEKEIRIISETIKALKAILRKNP